MHAVDRIVTSLLALILGLALFAATAATAVAEPALWVVKGPHTTVYLLGSIHILKKDTVWQTAKIDAAISASSQLWLEIPNMEDAAAMQPLAQKYGLDAEHPLSSKLTKGQLAHLDAVARQAGIPAGEAALEPFRPWLAAVSLSMAPLAQAGWDPGSGVEQTIKPLFTKENKPVYGFETIEQQLKIFADLPQKDEVAFLDESLKEVDAGPKKFEQIATAWSAGDVDAIDRQIDGEMRTRVPEVYQSLLVKRNQSWIPKLRQLLDGDGTAFVAVGAGHLAGPDSVVKLLEKAGYKVERVQ